MSDRDYSWEDQDPDEMQESLEFVGPEDDEVEDDTSVDEVDDDDETVDLSRPFYDDEWSEMARDESRFEEERLRSERVNFESQWEEYIDASQNLWGRIEIQDEKIDYPKLSSDETASTETAEPRLWTLKEDELLISMYSSHAVWSEIEQALERSKDVLVNRISRIAFPVREQQSVEKSANAKKTAWTQVEDDLIVNAYSQGESLLEAANQLTRTLNSVYLRLARLGVAKIATLDHMVYYKPTVHKNALKQNHPWTKLDEEQLLEAFDNGGTFASMLELTQRTPMGVVQNLYKNGRIRDEDLARFLESIRPKGVNN